MRNETNPYRKVFKFSRLTLTTYEVSKLSLQEQKSLVLLSMASEDIRNFSSLIAQWEGAWPKNPVLEAAHTSQFFSLFRVLCAKIVEAEKLVASCNADLRKSKSPIAKSIGRKVSDFKTLKNDKWYGVSTKVRNKISSHYDLSLVEGVLSAQGSIGSIEVYIHKKRGNTIYDIGGQLALLGVFHESFGEKAEDYESILSWIAWSIAFHEKLSALLEAFIVAILEIYFPTKRLQERIEYIEQEFVVDPEKRSLPILFQLN